MNASERKTLRQWRTERGKTQLELAYEAGLSVSTIADIETSKKLPTLRNAIKIAKALDVEIADIEWPDIDDK